MGSIYNDISDPSFRLVLAVILVPFVLLAHQHRSARTFLVSKTVYASTQCSQFAYYMYQQMPFAYMGRLLAIDLSMYYIQTSQQQYKLNLPCSAHSYLIRNSLGSRFRIRFIYQIRFDGGHTSTIHESQLEKGFANPEITIRRLQHTMYFFLYMEGFISSLTIHGNPIDEHRVVEKFLCVIPWRYVQISQ